MKDLLRPLARMLNEDELGVILTIKKEGAIGTPRHGIGILQVEGHGRVRGDVGGSGIASEHGADFNGAFLEILVDKKQGSIAVNWDDDIVKATALTRDGAVIHPSFASQSAA